MDDLRALARAVDAQRPAIPDELLRAQRQRLLADRRARVRGVRPGSVMVASGALALSLAGALLFALRGNPPPQAPSERRAGRSVGGSPKEHTSARSNSGPFEHKLKDGTRIRLDSGALGELGQEGARDVRFDLRRGRAEFDVTPNRSRTFRVLAGDYEVRVLGTRFSVDYDPANGLAVAVARGIVSVSTPNRATARLEAGERLAVTGGHWSVERAAAEPRPDAGSANTMERRAEATPLPDGAERRPSVPSRNRRSSTDWRRRYLARDYAGALNRARDLGLERLALRLDAAALADLADAARLGGDPAVALQLLTTLERRFPDTESGSRASFLSGRLLAREGRHAEAISAFERYLGRDPDGAYTSETRGRLIQEYANLGQRARARALAEAYLERYPRGPYRRLARSFISGR